MQIISNVAMISINETLWVQMLSFLLFLYIMNRIMFRPLRGVMGERKDYIEQIKTDTVAAGQTYEELTNSGQESGVGRPHGRQQGQEEKEAAGSREADKILADVLEQIRSLRKEAESDVARQVATAKTQLAAETEALVIAVMEKVLERRVSP